MRELPAKYLSPGVQTVYINILYLTHPPAQRVCDGLSLARLSRVYSISSPPPQATCDTSRPALHLLRRCGLFALSWSGTFSLRGSLSTVAAAEVCPLTPHAAIPARSLLPLAT